MGSHPSVLMGWLPINFQILDFQINLLIIFAAKFQNNNQWL